MQLVQTKVLRQPSIKTFPMQKSNSAAALILYGDKNSHNYADSLLSYKKDFATMDRQQRERHYLKKTQSLERKKQIDINRQISLKQKQYIPLCKITQRQKDSLQKYNSGQLKSTLCYSIPVNPVNSRYHNNKYGQNLAEKDEDRKLNTIVRGHYLHTIGSSGYNIISGKPLINFDNMVPKDKHEAFQYKLNKLYSRYNLNPEIK